MKRVILLVGLCIASTGAVGCDTGFQTVGSTEHGVVFSALPPFLGGGMLEKLVRPGEKELILPWEKLYRLNTGVQSVAWGARGEGDAPDVEDFVQTRLIDGNEINLSMTVRFRVIPEKVGYVIQNVGVDNEAILRLVSATARSDIRTYMNELRTDDFLTDSEKRQQSVDRVRDALNARLRPEGIEIETIIYNKRIFGRPREDGSLDTSYEDQINETEQVKQRVEGEQLRKRTVEEEMKKKFALADGDYRVVVQQADAKIRQAKATGDAKFEAWSKDAERVAAVGQNEIEAMKKEIEAVSGPGGEAVLRRELMKAMIERDPKFFVLSGGEGKAGGVEVQRVDTNDLIRQIGAVAVGQEALSPKLAPEDKGRAAMKPAAE